MANPRICALEALRRTRKDGAYSNIVLDAVLEEYDLSAVDRGFVSALYYGVLERTYTLDYMIGALCSSGSKKIAPLVMECLRMGLYQIKFMDKVPDSAAVNETVKIVKKKCAGAVGFVNAVLRRACREEINLPQGLTAEDMSIRYSCDLSIARELIDNYGAECADKFLASSVSAAPVFIRVNTCRTSVGEVINRLAEQGITAERCGIAEALKLSSIGSVERNPMYAEGLFHVEDLAAQWAVKALDPKADERVLDICAAPGGKTFSAAEYMGGTGQIVSCDLYESRVGLVKSGAERLGLSNVSCLVADSSVYDESLGQFHRVLCDVPCSGIGIIRRKPDIKYKSVSDFADLPQLQLALLNNGAKYLQSGGRLVYSTCTLRPEENDDVVDAFLAANPTFREIKVDLAGEYLSRKTFMPHLDGTDGFYIAILEKE